MSKEVELRKTHIAPCICDQLINNLITKPRYHFENLQQPYFKSRFGEQIPSPNKSPYFLNLMTPWKITFQLLSLEPLKLHICNMGHHHFAMGCRDKVSCILCVMLTAAQSNRQKQEGNFSKLKTVISTQISISCLLRRGYFHFRLRVAGP